MAPQPVIAMIHGLIGSLDYFDPAERITCADVRTIDLLGYGTSRTARREYRTLRNQTDHIAAHIEAWSAAPVWVLGHSMGGAIAVLLADRRPDLVRGLISVEGNFTGKDTFWSAKIVRKSLQDWTNEYQKMRRDVRAWTERVGVEPTERAVAWMTTILDHQPASTVYAMSHAILDETLSADYLASVQRVIDRDVPIHLIAGERSAGSWGVPEFARAAARTDTVIPHTGHLMMLEDPDAFCRTVDKILAPDTTST